MPYSIQLRFDRESELKILGLSESLAEIGLTDPKKSHGSLPHVAAAVFRDCEPEALIDTAKKVSRQSFDIVLNSIGSFPTSENVIFLGLADCRVLSALHLDLYRQVGSRFTYDRYYEPVRWHPHCTIGIDFTDDEFLSAFSHLKTRFIPLTCKVDRLVITKFRPSEVLFERLLD